jgi:hypothetical protein
MTRRQLSVISGSPSLNVETPEGGGERGWTLRRHGGSRRSDLFDTSIFFCHLRSLSTNTCHDSFRTYKEALCKLRSVFVKYFAFYFAARIDGRDAANRRKFFADIRLNRSTLHEKCWRLYLSAITFKQCGFSPRQINIISPNQSFSFLCKISAN